MQSQQRRCTNQAVFQLQSGFSLRSPQRLRRQTACKQAADTQLHPSNQRKFNSQLAVAVAWEKTGDPAYYVSRNPTQRRASSTPVVRKQPSKHLNPREYPMIHSLFQPFTSEQFHALLNSLFKVLFNFPSRYLFAIGLVAIFSFRWSLPPTLSCTHKQLDSRECSTHSRTTTIQASHPLWANEAAFQRTWAVLPTAGNEPPKHHIPSCP
jgi:hypothetical protein